MQSRHFLSVRHNPTSYRLLFAWLAFLASTVALADEPGPRKVVALDHSTADLLRACFPAIEFEVLVQFENEPSATINRRAWSTRDADVLVFRSDQISIRSQLFRERLMTQGIRTVDLKAHISIKRALQLRLDADRPNFLRSNVRRLVALIHLQHPISSPTHLLSKHFPHFKTKSPSFKDVELPSNVCPPCATATESRRQVMAKVSTRDTNEQNKHLDRSDRGCCVDCLRDSLRGDAFHRWVPASDGSKLFGRRFVSQSHGWYLFVTGC